MRATLITALLCAASLSLLCARAQPSEADRQGLAQLRADAEKGDAEPQCELGRRYYGGQGVATNYVEAVRWWRKAAEQNHAQSQYSLGFCYWNGQGVAQDYVEAVKWYRKAAEQNYARAQYILGTCCGQGQGVGKDLAEAVKWFRKAAEQNYADAQFNLGACYCNGDGVTKDYVEAYKWWLLSAAQGYAAARQNMTVLERQLTREQIAEGQKRASDFKPTEVPSLDTQRGEPARKPLADLHATTATGDAQAHKALGQALPAGKDPAAKDSAEAVKWFACPDNRKQSSGDRAKDEAEASKWYLLALRSNAATGNAEAQNALGEAFYAGKLGAVKNAAEAVRWFRMAAEQNLAAAQSKLGVCYERGDGVAKYELEAYKWDLLAAAQGDTKAKRNASLLELMLSPEEIAEGKRRAQAWLEQRKQSSNNNRCTHENHHTEAARRGINLPRANPRGC
jgi:uncharacterized protein